MSIAVDKVASLSAMTRTALSVCVESYRLLVWRLAMGITVIAALQLLSWASPIMPSPLAIGYGLGRLLVDPAIYLDFGVTLFEALVGIAIAGLSGVALGVLVGVSRSASDFLSPIIIAIYAVPKIVFLPVLMILLGTGIAPKIGNAAFHAFFPIMLNTLTGMQSVLPLHKKVARSLHATPKQTIFNLYLPSMVMPVFAGVRLAMGLAVLGAVLAELFEARAGAGHAVMDFYEKGMMPEMIAIVVIMLVLIVLINFVMSAIERRLSRWRNAK